MARRRDDEEAIPVAVPPAHLLEDTEAETTTATTKDMESEPPSTQRSSSSRGACAVVANSESRTAMRHGADLQNETSRRKRRENDGTASNQHDSDNEAQVAATIRDDTKQVVAAAGKAAEDDGDHRMDEPFNTEVDMMMTSPELGDDNDDNGDADSVDDCCSLASLLSADRCSTTSSMDVDCAENIVAAPRRKWIHAIQNESYQPKPTAFSPLGSFEEDPLLGQRRQCRDKLNALEHVRSRVQFFPFFPATATTRENASSSKMEPSMNIQTRMILSKLDDDCTRGNLRCDEEEHFESLGIEALSGLESLFFTYLTHKELIRVSEVCRSWKSMARHNLIWEPTLFTPFERYPLRELLGVGKELPAMQVFMIFKRLRLTELPRQADTRSSAEVRRIHLQPPHRGRIADERERLRTWLRAQEDRVENGNVERTRSVIRQTMGRSRSGSTQTPPTESIHLVRFRGENPMAEAQDWPAAVTLQDQVPVLIANNRARTDRDDDEIHFVKDGYRRTSLRVWLLQQQRKVSEHTLRSFLRQMLLAIYALEQVGVLHADISTTSILVLERASKSATESAEASSTRRSQQQQPTNINTDETPVFQLHCSVNTWYVGTQETPNPRQQQQQPAAHRQHERHERRLEEELLRIRRREAEQLDMFAALDEMDDMDDIVGIDGGPGGAGGGDGLLEFAQLAFQHRFRPPCMLNSLLRCAISLWARGRFPDTNQNTNMPLLNLLVTLHAHIPVGFRSFVEFAKFLMLSGTPTASRLLHHAYITGDPCNKASIPIRATQTQDVLDYQASVLTWYGNAQAVAAHATTAAAKQVAKEVALPNELMPRTQMGAAYFQHALEESNLPQERFVSIVAPVVKSSSWIRRLAMTQSHTLQRLDLSNVMLPTSVLLKELSNLPRITHLRLPGNIERPDDLEHFLAALSCTDLLPNLRAMDENVKLAMDRIEKTYLDQLGMVEFLLGR